MYKNVLVAIEPGDKSARTVLDAAREIVGPDAERRVLYVVDYQDFAFYLDPVYSGSAAETLRARAMKAAREILADECQAFRFPAGHQLVVVGDPASKIQEVASEFDCDLIVMGTHGPRGWRRLLGSVANEVLHGNQTDVYVVRIPEHGEAGEEGQAGEAGEEREPKR